MNEERSSDRSHVSRSSHLLVGLHLLLNGCWGIGLALGMRLGNRPPPPKSEA